MTIVSPPLPAAPIHKPLLTEARIEGLDGLRGLAMLMVILAHLFLLNAGWLGLQSFFVLSGFLITRILLKDRDRAGSFGRFLGLFYMRRLLRVFPVYYVYLVAVALGGWLLGRLEPLAPHLPYAFSYTYNYFHTTADYPHSYFFSHLWSLAVEEQFYLIWPLVLWALPTRWLLPAFVSLVLAGPLLRGATLLLWPPDFGIALSPKVPQVMYLLTSSHLDAFAAGALINLIRWRPRYPLVLAALALLLVVGVLVNGPGLGANYVGGPILSLGWPLMMPRSFQFIWGYSLVNLFWLLTILAIINPANPGGLFRWPLLDWLGKRSYSTYIVHYPILFGLFPLWDYCRQLTGQTQLGTLLLMLVYLPLTFLVAHLSYLHVELPLLTLKERYSTPAVRPAPP